MHKDSRIYVMGHRGLVGSAIVRALTRAGYTNILSRTHTELDLRDAAAVNTYFDHERPEYIFLAAAKVGGILANNTMPVDFISDNLAIELNAITAAHRTAAKKLLFLGSSCIYPRLAPQPIVESSLLTGPLEETNRAYAIAKIAGIELCRSYRRQYGDAFIAVMPTNLYGPHDSFDLQTSHVLPALIRRFDDAKKQDAPVVTLWGTGSPRREFLHVDDLAEACLFLMETYDNEESINIGTGEDLSIAELAGLVRRIVGYTGETTWDASKPDGTPRKLLHVSKIHQLGWHHRVSLEDGIRATYQWYLANDTALRP